MLVNSDEYDLLVAAAHWLEQLSDHAGKKVNELGLNSPCGSLWESLHDELTDALDSVLMLEDIYQTEDN